MFKKLFSIMLAAGLLAGLVGSLPSFNQAQAMNVQTRTAHLSPLVSVEVHHDLSRPLREASGVSVHAAELDQPRLVIPKPSASQGESAQAPDEVLQPQAAEAPMPAPDFNFEGLNNQDNAQLVGGLVIPPDTNGDIGKDHYVQWVNLVIGIWQIDRANHTSTLVYKAAGNALWSGFGAPCENNNDGDPIILYDHLAERWLAGQMARDNNSGPFYQCIAVSQTSDPTGAWYRYAYKTSDTQLNDYPKLAVWPDGYYLSYNQFTWTGSGYSWGGVGVVAFERDKMLLGQTAQMIYFNLGSVNINYSSLLPSDLDGAAPPANTPNYFAAVDDSSAGLGPDDAMRIWEFRPNWQNPGSSTFGLNGNPNYTLNTANFNPLCASNSVCIPQPSTIQKLDSLADRVMHRLQYRNLGGYAALVANHTVDAGLGQAGVRWYELRNNGANWAILQQGTYTGSSANSDHRWMGSIAMDQAGNVAVGYSVSSSLVYPTIRYAGRLAGDPAGTLPQSEVSIIAGNGAQTDSTGRWGDYTMMAVDPTDGCTFWYTNEYLPSTSSRGWNTRIASFAFPSCLNATTGVLSGQVLDASTNQPLSGVRVQANSYTTFTTVNGNYQFPNLPAGTYTVTANLYSYLTAQATGITVEAGKTTTQNFALATNRLFLAQVFRDFLGLLANP